MDPKPFRCVYDPELSRSKSQGSKPIFIRCKTDQQTSDPRVGRGRSVGKRVVPATSLPLPAFVTPNSKPPVRRCLITGVGPLVSRSRLYDAMTQFGVVEDCQIVISQTTGASLGIAWVVFEKHQTHAAQVLVESSQQGQLNIENHETGLEVKLDDSGSLLKEAERKAERMAISQLTETRDTKNGANGSGSQIKDDDLQIVELRSLNPAQVTKWYDKYLGPEPSYVLIRDIFLSVKRHNCQEIAKLFQAFPFSHIAVNRSGFYICFKHAKDAMDCYLKMNRKAMFGVAVKLMITLDGKRYKYDEVVAMQRKADEERQFRNGTSSFHSTNLTKTLRPGQPIQSHLLDESANRVLAGLGSQMKKAVWPRILSSFVSDIVERELIKMWKLEDEAAINRSNPDRIPDSDTGSQNDDSKESTPATGAEAQAQEQQQAVGFGARRGGTIGMTARALPGYGVVRPMSHLPGLRIRKRHSEAPLADTPSIKKRKPLQVTASAPNSYIRAPIKQAPDVKSIKTEEPFEMEPENRDSDNDSDTSERSSMDVDEQLSEEEHKMDYEGDEEEEEEESDDESRGMMLPDPSLDYEPTVSVSQTETLDYQTIQKLVQSADDFATLKQLLGLSESNEDGEYNAIFNLYVDEFRPKLHLDPTNWSSESQEQSFRVAPYRHITDDERREYLPNLGPGVPNEIVQSYKERPLYEGFEEVEEEESRKDSRALNVSRSAFGVNADLFADDNLSKNAKDTRLARSAIHDWGLYANETVPANDFVIEYVGDILRDEYAEIRERHYALEGIDSTYLFRLDNGTVIDATKRGNGARFINHSCDPNCTAQVFDYEGFKRVVLFSLRDIEPDEELTFDYNFVKSQDEDGKVRCACGAANCRGWLM